MFGIFKFIKDFLLFLPLTLIFQPLSKSFLFISYWNKLIIWIRENKKNVQYNDFYSPIRDYNKRYNLYQYLITTYSLNEQPITYLEFGVAGGDSFRWWISQNLNQNSHFFGFDTFEGLPEDWGGYQKGDMSANIPQLNDTRAEFFKGLFQETLNPFITKRLDLLNEKHTKLIHMDADLYSATVFTLSQLAQFLKKGDIITFDEFSVPMHEFKAYTEFVACFPIKLKPIASVNNFYQTAFIVE